MARILSIYIRRSDGTREVISGKAGRKEANQPTAEQMDQKPDKNGVSDYYREVAPDEVKHLDWRRKLGGMLVRELGSKEKESKDTGYVLVNFPEGFRLYEHVKKSEKDGKEVKKSHSAAGSDRQDAYLYGHPSGRRKRYRSPADFFPHLLWLCTDESGDHDNCSCKICCPDEMENIIPGAKAKVKEVPVKVGVEVKPVKVPVKTESASSLLDQKPEQKSIQPPLSRDQQLDSRYGGFKYRQGELVWFRRGQAWGLGIITFRQGEQGNLLYAVQPLSYPGHNQQPTQVTSDGDLRPWLAWSVPRFTHGPLNDQNPIAMYENVDWASLMQGRYGEGNLEIDASILAAKSTDSTYTPFSVIGSVAAPPNAVDTYYNGLFLGAEKIWLREPVRLANGTDILVIKAITERSVNDGIGPMYLIGDIYSLTMVSHSNPGMPSLASPSNNPNLPQRLTEDLAYRNARSIQMRQIAHYWKLAQTDARIDLDHVKGRWYETSTMLPILQEEAFRQGNEGGELQELGVFLNSRGDCLLANRDRQLTVARINNRKLIRKDAFAAAVPNEFMMIDDIQPAPTAYQING